METTQKATFYFAAATDITGSSVKSFFPPTGVRIGYKIDEPEFPNCVKVWFGTKTLIAPLRNLLLLELDL